MKIRQLFLFEASSSIALSFCNNLFFSLRCPRRFSTSPNSPLRQLNCAVLVIKLQTPCLKLIRLWRLSSDQLKGTNIYSQLHIRHFSKKNHLTCFIVLPHYICYLCCRKRWRRRTGRTIPTETAIAWLVPQKES